MLEQVVLNKEAGFHIFHVEIEGISYKHISDALPERHIYIPLICKDGTYGIATFIRHLYDMAPEGIEDDMGGFMGKIIKSLYPQADIDVEPYPDIDGPIVYYAVGYLMDRVAKHMGIKHVIWVLDEFPFDEDNHMVKLFNHIIDMKTDISHNIIVLSDSVKLSRSRTLLENIPLPPMKALPKDESYHLLMQIALMGLPSYGYVLKKSLRRRLLRDNETKKTYRLLLSEGYIEEYGVFVRFSDRRIYRYLLRHASEEDIKEATRYLDRKTPGSLFARAYLYTMLGDRKRTLASMKLYISIMKRRRLYRLAHTHMKPIVQHWQETLGKTDIEQFLYVASVAEQISDLEIGLIETLLDKYNPSPTILFMLSCVYPKLPDHLKDKLKSVIQQKLEIYHPIKSSLLAHAMLTIIYHEKNFQADAVQKYMLLIRHTSFGDPEVDIRGHVLRSRLHIIFHKDKEALRELQQGIEKSKAYGVPWHLGILYNNLSVLIMRRNLESHLDLSLLSYKAYETSFAYSLEGSFIPLANFIYVSAPMGKKYGYLLGIWNTFKPILENIMEPKDHLAVLWALGHLHQSYGYYEEVIKTLQTMKHIIDTYENIPPTYKALYYNIATKHALENGDLHMAEQYLSTWKMLIKDKYDERYEKLATLKDAIFSDDDTIYTQSFDHIYYSSVKTGKFAQGISHLKHMQKSLLRRGRLTEIAKVELFIAGLYKMEGNIPAYRTHLHNALSIYTHIDAAHAKYIAQVLKIPPSYIESEGMKDLAGIHVSQLLISSIATFLSSARSVEELFKKVLTYLTLPASNMWILFSDGEKYFMEYSIFKGIGILDEKYYKMPDTILRSKKLYDLGTLPSYIYIKKTGEGGSKLVIYAENRYIEKAFTEHHLAWLDMWSDMVLSILENIKLGEKAIKDAVTNLYTRWYIMSILRRELHLARRERTPLSVLFIDIDDFKHINDTLGHLEGDKVLSKVASAISRNIRITDYAGRYGGEEFVVVLPDTHEDEARLVAKRIKDAIKDDPSIPTTVCVGISTYYPKPRKKVSPETLIRQADRAMYHAKKIGKNLIVHYNEIKQTS